MTRNAWSPPSSEKEIGRLGGRADQLERRVVAMAAQLHIKVFPDEDLGVALPVASGDGKFIEAIAEDMDNMTLIWVEAFVTTVSSSGIVQVQLRNITQAVDMLSTRVQVDAGEKNSRTAATAYVIDAANADVDWGDEIAVDVDQDGTGVWGLGVHLGFGFRA